MIILASASPRRTELLSRFLISHICHPSTCPEPDRLPREAAADFVCRAAILKARNVAELYPEKVILGADTIVEIDNQFLGKPVDKRDASDMLKTLSGRAHRVLTGLALLIPGQDPVCRSAETTVFFRHLSPEEITWYLDSGDGLDKAGAYGIQSLGGALIDRISGDWFNVVGLPIPVLLDLLCQYYPGVWPPKPK